MGLILGLEKGYFTDVGKPHSKHVNAKVALQFSGRILSIIFARSSH